MDFHKALDIIANQLAQQTKSLIVSKIFEVLEVHLLLMKLGLSKPTIAIILLCL